MKIKKPSALEFSAIVAILVVLFAILLPALMRAPSKHGLIRTPPGVSTVLRQVYIASTEYALRKGKAPSSLDDLEKITVPNSNGEKMLFSIKALEQELGTNASAVRYFPEFRALEFDTMTGNEIVLAYIPELNNTGFGQVIFRNGRMQRVRLSDVQRAVEQQEHLLEGVKRESATNEPANPGTN
jgi:hypothetical protein